MRGVEPLVLLVLLGPLSAVPLGRWEPQLAVASGAVGAVGAAGAVGATLSPGPS